MPAVQVQGEDDISVIMNRISCVVFAALVSLSCTSSDFVRRSVEERSLPEDSVAMDVRLARTVWKDAAWAGEYDRNIFQEYVLPPQVADEPVEYRWREDIPRWLSPDIGPEDDLITAARKINAAVDVPVKPETWGRAVFEDVGADILYLPCLYENTGPVPAGAPVIVRQDSIEKILPGPGMRIAAEPQ